MACRARGRETGGRMPRICRALVFSRVTGITVTRGPRVFAAYMAKVALHTGMRAGQCEPCRAVIERCSRPGNRVVACRTLLREARRCVVRVCRAAVLG